MSGSGRPAGPKAGRKVGSGVLQEATEKLRSRREKAGAPTVSLVVAGTLLGRKKCLCLFSKAVLFVVVLETRKIKLTEG